MIKIGMIAACDLCCLIGYTNGKIPWKKPVDMKRFKELTMDSTLIVGRKTRETLPLKGLPGRAIISISSSIEHRWPSFNSIQEALEFCPAGRNIWIVGGAQIYRLGFEFADFIDLTIINEEIKVEDPNEAIYFPYIPERFKLESETINKEDDTLTHRRYINTSHVKENQNSETLQTN